MSTKTKTFEECKNKSARKFGFKDFEEIYSTDRKDWSIGAIYEEAAELYASEKIRRAIELAKEGYYDGPSTYAKWRFDNTPDEILQKLSEPEK